MDLTTVFGNVAAILTTLSFVPQAIQTIRTKETKAISLPMYLMFVTGVVFWFIYGWQLGAWPIIIANAITFIFAGTILVYKIGEPRRIRKETS